MNMYYKSLLKFRLIQLMKWPALMIAFLFLGCCIENTEFSDPKSIGEVVQFVSAGRLNSSKTYDEV